MLATIEAIIAIILVLLLLSLRRSEKKWIAFLAWAIYILIKIVGN